MAELTTAAQFVQVKRFILRFCSALSAGLSRCALPQSPAIAYVTLTDSVKTRKNDLVHAAT